AAPSNSQTAVGEPADEPPPKWTVRPRLESCASEPPKAASGPGSRASAVQPRPSKAQASTAKPPAASSTPSMTMTAPSVASKAAACMIRPDGPVEYELRCQRTPSYS